MYVLFTDEIWDAGYIVWLVPNAQALIICRHPIDDVLPSPLHIKSVGLYSLEAAYSRNTKLICSCNYNRPFLARLFLRTPLFFPVSNLVNRALSKSFHYVSSSRKTSYFHTTNKLYFVSIYLAVWVLLLCNHLVIRHEAEDRSDAMNIPADRQQDCIRQRQMLF